MPEPATTCSRCGQHTTPEGTIVAIERGPLRETFPTLQLCPRCTESLSIWLTRHHATWTKADTAGAGVSSPERPSSGRRRRQRQRRGGSNRSGRRAAVLNALFYVVLLGGIDVVLGVAVVILVRELHRK